jgi:hypothetical protein
MYGLLPDRGRPNTCTRQPADGGDGGVVIPLTQIESGDPPRIRSTNRGSYRSACLDNLRLGNGCENQTVRKDCSSDPLALNSSLRQRASSVRGQARVAARLAPFFDPGGARRGKLGSNLVVIGCEVIGRQDLRLPGSRQRPHPAASSGPKY